MGDNWLQEAIEHQRAGLAVRLAVPLAQVAERCVPAWDDKPDALDRTLSDNLDAVSPCNLLYAVDTAGRQLSANVSPGHVDTSVRGQNLADRPYLVSAVPCSGFLLSDVYISRVTSRPCVTAVQAVTQMGQVVGFIAADFVLRDLPLVAAPARGAAGWRQIKGDPAIRATVFSQQRITSEMDRHMPDVIAIMDELLGERGVFHAKLHFSSSRATLWLTDDPYRYRVHVLGEITDPAMLLAYPRQPYSRMAVVTRDRIRAVFERFAQLRTADDTFYLRAGSLNVINGMVGLTFSCDGSHYLPAGEFLARDGRFAYGA
jgi:hypothetical protein